MVGLTVQCNGNKVTPGGFVTQGLELQDEFEADTALETFTTCETSG